MKRNSKPTKHSTKPCYLDPKSIRTFYENITKQIEQYEKENGISSQEINLLNSTDQYYLPKRIPRKPIPVSKEVWKECKSWDFFFNMWLTNHYQLADDYDRNISYESVHKHFHSSVYFFPRCLSLGNLNINDENS